MTARPPPGDGAVSHIPALDGFRAGAVLIVMLSHVGLERVVPGGFGVTIFFFLSGFLITTLLRREFDRARRIDFGAFYFRRVVRILPPLYAAVALVLLLAAAGLHHPITVSGLIWDAAFLTNYVSASGVSVPLWSLDVEEHFYLGFPLLVAVLARRSSWGLAGCVSAGLCALILLTRLDHYVSGASVADIHNWTHTRVDSILFGCILALWRNPVLDDSGRMPDPASCYVAALLVLAPTFAIRDEWFRYTIRYSIQGIGLMFLFSAAIRDKGPIGAMLENRTTRFVALLSYSLYLVHNPLIIALKPLHAVLGPILGNALALALSFLVAWIIYVIIERPLGRWRRDVERRREASRAVAVTSWTLPENTTSVLTGDRRL